MLKYCIRRPEMLLKGGLRQGKQGAASCLKTKNAQMPSLNVHFATSRGMKIP